MNKRISYLKGEWSERWKRLGTTKRSVLFKRFPAWLNNSIHNQHARFCSNNISDNTKSLLDVRCGYGRISSEVKQKNSNINVFQSMDLCTEFALAYEKNIGPCFNGPAQHYCTDDKFDTVIIITLLMHLELGEQLSTLKKMWAMLNPEGRLIIIEPATFTSLYSHRKVKVSPP